MAQNYCSSPKTASTVLKCLKQSDWGKILIDIDFLDGTDAKSINSDSLVKLWPNDMEKLTQVKRTDIVKSLRLIMAMMNEKQCF